MVGVDVFEVTISPLRIKRAVSSCWRSLSPSLAWDSMVFVTMVVYQNVEGGGGVVDSNMFDSESPLFEDAPI